MRETIGDDGKRIARHEIRAAGGGIFRGKVRPVEARCADIDADRFLLKGWKREICVLQRAPGHRQQQALLRIHRHRFAARKAEDARIEHVDVVYYSSGERIGLACISRIGMPETRLVPASGRNFANGAFPPMKQVKQLQRRTSPRSNSGISDNFNRHGHQTPSQSPHPQIAKRHLKHPILQHLELSTMLI